MSPDTRDDVVFQLSQLRRLLSQYEPLILLAQTGEPDRIEILATAGLLHSFYGGIENIFKRIALDLDPSLPSGSRWHSELLQSMRTPAQSRPAVISDALAARLQEYLNFRHVFRQAYSFQLQWHRMAQLVFDCQEVLDELESELRPLLETES